MAQARERIDRAMADNKAREMEYRQTLRWPPAKKGEIVFKMDMGLELGRPGTDSLSFLMWTNNRFLVQDTNISLIGPDIGEIDGDAPSFGKVVFVAGKGFDRNTNYERYREMDLSRFDVSLRGFMVRAVSRQMREWCRLSREALVNGFSFADLGSALIQKLKAIDYVDAVEVIFMVNPEDIESFDGIGRQAIGYIDAMRQMNEEMHLDCDTCDYQKICDQAEDLRLMREAIRDRARRHAESN
jgi:CO dehydrogenase/acetyl-CoA synthase beta subunit